MREGEHTAHVVKTQEMQPGAVPGRLTRALEAGDAGPEILVFGADVENDVEIVQNFWRSR